ncbi:prolyl endopeptidase FAP isoform X9 [Hydra vulgaris]|uniref:Prolyl endopeptidase FAP isoform X9 n=1 Tax=Hydra vulgaris TaxID=6087 RepID=A0ABM4C1J6_HYDVU
MHAEKMKYFRLSKDDDLLSKEMKSTYSDDYESSSSGESNDKSLCFNKTSNIRKIFFILFVVFSVVVGLAVAVALKKEDWILGKLAKRLSRGDSRKLLLDDVLGGKFSYESYSTLWISDHEYIHEQSDGISLYDMDGPSLHPIINGKEAQESLIDRVKKFSADRNYFLFSNKSVHLYRHSFYADYYVKDLKSGIIRRIKPPTNEGDQIRYASWSTNGSALVFVYKSNIYFIPTMDTLQMQYYQITKDGETNTIFNGVPDWVYEEEILASTHALEFSADGRYMAYVNFNATSVPYYKFPRYGSQDDSYTVIEKIAYPKAGYPNPLIKIMIVDLQSVVKFILTEKVVLAPPIEISTGDYYYAVMKWNKNARLFVQWMNRQQTNTICMLYEPGETQGVIVEKHKVINGWVDDDYVKPYFSKDGSYYLTMLPKDVGNEGKYRHIAKVLTQIPQTIEYLTDGTFTVQDLNCYNIDEEIIYFRSTESSSRYRHVYSYNLKTNKKNCITCGLIKDKETGANCTYYYPQFSKECSWVTLMCQGPFVPSTIMYNIKSKYQILLSNNINTRNALKEKDMPTVHYYTINSDGYDIPVRETRPYDFDPKRKYAVLFDVYGGPNTQKVDDMFTIEFSTIFPSYNIILVNFDARGSGYRGYKFLHAVYKRLGYYETIDAVNVAKYLKKQSYIDPNRFAIWGWSYGGFYAATVLADSHGVINTAVSVAPVTDWRYYDTVYSERYMGLPTVADDLKGYEETALMSKASRFKDKNFLLIHGTADDNVHFQNSAQLAAALVKEKVKFTTQFYTDKDHSINPRYHLYVTLATFLEDKLKLKTI